MFKNKKKGFTHLAVTVALTLAVINCAWADFNNNKLALNEDGDNYSFNTTKGAMEQYILDVNSPEALSIPSSTKLTGNVQISGNSKKVSLSLRDADIKQVLRMIADKTGTNIVFHDSASGKVTLDLKDVPVDTALKFVLDATELAFVRSGNNIIVASKDAIKDLSAARQNFSIIPVKYIDAKRFADYVNGTFFTGKYAGISSVPVVNINAAKNELVMYGTDDDEALVRNILSKLDVKPMMNTFPVNHVTPGEMAATICDLLLSDRTEGDVEKTSVDDNNKSSDDKISLGGGYNLCVIGGDSEDSSSDSNDMKQIPSNPLTVSYFPELGTVGVLGGSVEQVKMIEEFIKLNDKKQPMAYIELSLIQLSEEGSKIFNTEWRAWTPFGAFRFDSGGLTTEPTSPIFLKGRSYAVYENVDDDEPQFVANKLHGWGPLALSLNYLVENNKGRVLSNPKIMVTNGKKSTIDLTSDYVKSIKQEFDTGSTTAIAQTTYEIASDQGIKVEITPFISPEGYVVMNLKPDYSTIKSSGRNGEYTLLTRRNLELNNIRVKDGETLVLAGMIQENERHTTAKLPILGDLPVVGTFFRRTSNQSDKEELVILITPHIVYSKDQIDKLKAEEKL